MTMVAFFSFFPTLLAVSLMLTAPVLASPSSKPSDGLFLPPLNTFTTISPPNTGLNLAYQFGPAPITFTTFYGLLKSGEVNYFTVDLTDINQLLRITLFRSVNPSQTRFFPGIVLMGPNRLEIDKSAQIPGYFPNSVQIPQGYDTYVRFNNEKNDFDPIYVGLIPFTYYQMLSFNATQLEIGKYVIAVFNSESDGATDGAYALTIGNEIQLTFDVFMLGPFHAFFIYEWQGWNAGLILIPYWIIIVIALLIISHQTFYKGNSPRSWYSMVVCIGGYLTIGSGCVVIGQLAYSFLQVSTPNPDSLLTVAITCGMFIGPLFCGILLVFFGLMHRANNLIRLSVMFLAIGACLVWASYYVGPGIALIGAFLPSNKWIPFHLCCSWLKDIDDENRETTIKAEADVDWDKRYEEEEKKNQAKAVAARALAEKQEASAAAARAAGGDEDDIRLAMGPDATLEPETGISDPLLAGISDPAIVGSSQPFPSDSGIQLISADQDGDDDDSTETDPGPSMAASSSGIHQQREDIDD